MISSPFTSLDGRGAASAKYEYLLSSFVAPSRRIGQADGVYDDAKTINTGARTHACTR